MEQLLPLRQVVVPKEIQSLCRRTCSQTMFCSCKDVLDGSTHHCRARLQPEASAARPRMSGRERPLGRERSKGERSTGDTRRSRSRVPPFLTFPVRECVGCAEPHRPGAVVLQQARLGAQKPEPLHRQNQIDTFVPSCPDT